MAASPSKKPHHLQPLATHFHNRSISSIASGSDVATFHSAQGHSSPMELGPVSPTLSRTIASPASTSKTLPSPRLESIKMSRQDSGFDDGEHSGLSSARTSCSSTRQRSASKPRRRTTTSSNGSSRPSTKRAGFSTPSSASHVRNSSSSGRRPGLRARHTTPYGQSAHAPEYQFFHFPTLSDPQEPDTVTSPTLPPATVHYWTSDSTRRLEYAAIDAASRGMRGFFIRLLPDCILPASSKRMRFHDGDADSDVGSVRRYRLALPEEKETGEASNRASRPGLWRRMTSFGRRSRSCG